MLIDTTRYDTQIQARNRVRHDIKMLLTKEPIDSDGQLIEYDQFKNEYPTGIYYNTPLIVHNIEDRYINTKLIKEDKDYLVNKYGMIPHEKRKATWQTLKHDLERANLKVVINNKGTFILHKDDDFKIIMKESKKKMNEHEELYNYLDSIINIKLFKDEQKELIENIGLKDARGRLQKSIGQLNAYLIENFNKSILSKRVKLNNQLHTVWIISEL